MFIQATAKFRDAIALDRKTGSMRVASEFLQQVATGSQSVEQMIRLDAPRRTMSDLAIERDDHARPVQTFSNL